MLTERLSSVIRFTIEFGAGQTRKNLKVVEKVFDTLAQSDVNEQVRLYIVCTWLYNKSLVLWHISPIKIHVINIPASLTHFFTQWYTGVCRQHWLTLPCNNYVRLCWRLWAHWTSCPIGREMLYKKEAQSKSLRNSHSLRSASLKSPNRKEVSSRDFMVGSFCTFGWAHHHLYSCFLWLVFVVCACVWVCSRLANKFFRQITG